MAVRIVQKCIEEEDIPEVFYKGVLVVIPKDVGLLE